MCPGHRSPHVEGRRPSWRRRTHGWWRWTPWHVSSSRRYGPSIWRHASTSRWHGPAIATADAAGPSHAAAAGRAAATARRPWSRRHRSTGSAEARWHVSPQPRRRQSAITSCRWRPDTAGGRAGTSAGRDRCSSRPGFDATTAGDRDEAGAAARRITARAVRSSYDAPRTGWRWTGEPTDDQAFPSHARRAEPPRQRSPKQRRESSWTGKHAAADDAPWPAARWHR